MINFLKLDIGGKAWHDMTAYCTTQPSNKTLTCKDKNIPVLHLQSSQDQELVGVTSTIYHNIYVQSIHYFLLSLCLKLSAYSNLFSQSLWILLLTTFCRLLTGNWLSSSLLARLPPHSDQTSKVKMTTLINIIINK